MLLAISALALLAAVGIAASGSRVVSADAPHPGLNFAIGVNVDGDADNDCGTGVPTAVGNGAPDPVSAQVSNTTCEVGEGRVFRANVYLMANGSTPAAGLSAHVTYAGVTTDERGDSVWDGCSFEASATGPGYENVGCVVGLPPAVPVTALGLIATFRFMCTADGSLTLSHEDGHTALTDVTLGEHREAGTDTLTIDCQEGLGSLAGDANCDGFVNSIDAALILQNTAGLLANIPCADGADANSNGTIDAIDAALVLQVSAGLIDEL